MLNTIAVALKSCEARLRTVPDPNRSTKSLGFPAPLQPLPGLRNTRTIHFESFPSIQVVYKLYAICMQLVNRLWFFGEFSETQDITGGCETRCSVQLPYAEERGHHLCEAEGEFSGSFGQIPTGPGRQGNVLILVLDTFGVWSFVVLGSNTLVLQSQNGPCHGSLKVIDVTAFVLLFSACFSDRHRHLHSIISKRVRLAIFPFTKRWQ